MLTADLIFWPVVVFLVACNLYYGPRISSDRIATQWGSDGKPTWHAPKAVGLLGMVAFLLAVRLLIWVLSTYTPSKVHGVELGLLLFSIIIAVSHVFVINKAIRKN